MKGLKFRITFTVASILLIMLMLSGCGGKQSEGETAVNGKISGSIVAVGSTALQPLVEKASQQFMAANPGAKIQVQGGGSGTGLTQVATGAADIGNSDIFAEEKSGIDASSLVDHKVAVVGFAAVTNPNVGVDNVSKQQLINIFTGKITNWKELGGQDKPIVVVNRAKGSGTRATFEKYALDGAQETKGDSLAQDSSGAVVKTVAELDGAISYLALSYLNSSIKALKIDGYEPSNENVTSGKYPVWSYEHMYTKGEPTAVAKAFIEYILSAEIQNTLVKDLKFIPITEMKIQR